LERKVVERTHELRLEKEKSEHLLLNILPAPIARELTERPGQIIAKKYPNVTVLFTDIVGFTRMSDRMTAEQVVTMLNKMVSRFDIRAKQCGIEKIKTIGDAYMAASGLSEDSGNDGAEKMLKFARILIEEVRDFNARYRANVKIRVGMNTGNLVAGVIGKTKFIYDVWGDTVNVASRMESTGEPMKIHVSESTYEQTKHLCTYSDGVDVEVKGKGLMRTYFLQPV
ncbi:MAG: adenylate/guanylate cyclase domain-containing protein, partial [Treponema sp.]|nr:adenylate/guanylate cyclase domain-containing protein [Treponema sp.]